ncbi:hypothetical protein BGX26_004527 [Mortierella sp. AD094]|nr:hypothetical protein BGX26_004527 [Mortierella sp. AD094]
MGANLIGWCYVVSGQPRLQEILRQPNLETRNKIPDAAFDPYEGIERRPNMKSLLPDLLAHRRQPPKHESKGTPNLKEFFGVQI